MGAGRFLQRRGRPALLKGVASDGHQSYVAAVGLTFGRDIDWAQLQKTYATESSGENGATAPLSAPGSKLVC
jgi:hypothetical protein